MKRRKDRYAGLMSRQSRRKKYAKCQYVRLSGTNRIRLLTAAEQAEFRARIQQILESRVAV